MKLKVRIRSPTRAHSEYEQACRGIEIGVSNFEMACDSWSVRFVLISKPLYHFLF
jgi:hypothetical protein